MADIEFGDVEKLVEEDNANESDDSIEIEL
jgi:hypothetical protein